MKRIAVLLMMTGFLTACQAREDHYYLTHPKQFQKVLDQCQQQAKPNQDCQHWQTLALQLQVMANELRFGPQAFGQKILSLQAELADEEQKLLQNPADSELAKAIAAKKEELALRLAVVKMMEAPES